MLSSPIEEIKNKLDIVDLVRDYVQLQKAGANYRALCPFHSEKSPSFFVSPGRQTWHCFGGCGEGGDVFTFIMKMEGVEFGDALRVLAQRTGVELTKYSPQKAAWNTEKKRYLDLVELTTKFFEKQLKGSTIGKEAQEYLKNRGLNAESLALWRIGYAPDGARALYNFLLSKGFSSEEVAKAGLLTRSENRVYDRFRARIMFPITDANGQVIGFGGRIFGAKENKDLAKYVNTSNSPVYDKSRALYGLSQAKLSIRKQDFCIVVEGYMDVILTSQAGYKNVVATSGTALTEQQLLLLKRYSLNFYAAFDKDEAGVAATQRGIDLALQKGFRVKVVVIPMGKDPADVAKENPKALGKAIKEAESVADFYFTSVLSKFNKQTPEGRADIAKALIPVIQKIPNRIERAYWIQRLSSEIETSEQDIRAELNSIRPDSRAVKKKVSSGSSLEQKGRKELLEERVLTSILKMPELLKEYTKETEAPSSVKFQETLAVFCNAHSLEFSDLQKVCSATQMIWINKLALTAEAEEEIDWKEEFYYCLKELRALELKDKLILLEKEIEKAEYRQDTKMLASLAEQFNTLSKKLYMMF